MGMWNQVGRRMGPFLVPSLASSVKSSFFSYSALRPPPSPSCHLHFNRFFSYSCLPPPPSPTCHLLFRPKEEGEEKESGSDTAGDSDDDETYEHGFLSLNNNGHSLNLAEKKVLMVDGTSCTGGAAPLFINNNRLQEYLGDSRCLGSSCGWLLLVKPEDCSLYLLNPFFPNPPVIPLPPLESLPPVLFSLRRRRGRHPGGHNSSSPLFAMDFTVSTEAKPVPSDELMFSGPSPLIHNFILSSSPSPCCSRLSSNASAAAAPTITHPKNDDCIAVLCGHHTFAFCRPGDPAWTRLNNGEFLDAWYGCPVFSHDKKMLYVSSAKGLQAWDLTDLSSPKLAFRKNLGRGEYYNREYYAGFPTSTTPGGGLLMAVRRTTINKPVQDKGTSAGRPAVLPYSTVGFDLHEFQFSSTNKTESKVVEDLGDNVLFLDHHHSTVVSAKDFPELKPNSIYFVDDNHLNYSGHDMGVFSLSDRSISPFFPPPYDSMKIQAGATWVIPSLS